MALSYRASGAGELAQLGAFLPLLSPQALLPMHVLVLQRGFAVPFLFFHSIHKNVHKHILLP